MLTIDQIKNVSFRKANIGGYRPDDVDSFIDDVQETVESLKKEKSELLGKMEILMKRIEEYREDEDSVHTALVSAQKLADQAVKKSKTEAQKILSDARKEAEQIVKDANAQIVAEKEQIVKIQQEAADVRQSLLDAYKLQIETLENLPDQAQVDTSKEKLEEKYPTRSYLQEEDNKSDTKEFTSIEEAAEAAHLPAEQSQADIAEGDTALSDDEGVIQLEKSAFEKKFGKLKFGEDYDISSETE